MNKQTFVNREPVIVRFRSLSGDVDVVMNQVLGLVNYDWKAYTGQDLKINYAQIRMDLANFKNDPDTDEFYPLRIYAQDKNGEVILMCSEFRIGYRGDSVDKLVRCLKALGFKLSPTTVETIYNEHKLDLTICKG